MVPASRLPSSSSLLERARLALEAEVEGEDQVGRWSTPWIWGDHQELAGSSPVAAAPRNNAQVQSTSSTTAVMAGHTLQRASTLRFTP